MAISACSLGGSNAKVSNIRIGYQRFTDLDVLRTRGTLEKRLKPDGITVEWKPFSNGPALLEALGSRSLDLGGTGEPPPIFAQAAGVPLVYVGTKPPAPESYGILVQKNSPIKTPSDLKGKKVAFVRGSSANYLIINALKSVNLKYTDIQPVNLAASDARPAFDRKKIDAWVIWDPFMAVAQQANEARILTTGAGGLGENRGFFLANRSFAETNQDLVKTVLDELNQSEIWAKDHPQELAQQFAPQLGLDVSILKTVLGRRSYGVEAIDDAVLNGQQSIADTFTQLKILPKTIDIKEAVWKTS